MLLTKKLEEQLQLTSDLADELKHEMLCLKLENLPSNTIGEQLWCMIGARESFYQGIMKSKWQGFSCSLKDTTDIVEIRSKLKKTQKDLIDYLNKSSINEAQEALLIDLLIHESQHHGQLIRYVYGNKLKFPLSWQSKYTV